MNNKIAQNQAKKNILEFKQSLKNATFESIETNWYLNNLLTPSLKDKFKAGKISISELKKVLIAKKMAEQTKELEKYEAALLSIKAARDFEKAQISIVWVKSKTWGANPHGEMWATGGYFKDSGVSGCGYDKQSTSVANLLNQCDSVLKLVLKKSKSLPYGVTVCNYTGLPRFSGGVGVSCFREFFNKVGFVFEHTGGKTYDSIIIRKMTRKEKADYKKRGY